MKSLILIAAACCLVACGGGGDTYASQAVEQNIALPPDAAPLVIEPRITVPASPVTVVLPEPVVDVQPVPLPQPDPHDNGLHLGQHKEH